MKVVGAELYEQRREQLQRVLQGERIEIEIESVANDNLRYLHTTYIPDIRIDGATHGAFTLSTDVTALKLVEQELRNLARIDTAARLTGDEFVIIVEGFSVHSEVESIAHKLIEAVRRPMSAADTEIQISTSIGIAFTEAEEITPAELSARADHALYDAKAAGRNTFTIYRGDALMRK
jgi:predicted signal transduction protein with EAL and GGDEF domain